MEAKLQTEIITWLRKSQHCYVIKTKVQPGTPVGCPDILFFKEGFWGAIEVKSSRTAKWQPLQKETLAKLDNWSYARRVDPDNWHEVKAELQRIL